MTVRSLGNDAASELANVVSLQIGSFDGAVLPRLAYYLYDHYACFSLLLPDPEACVVVSNDFRCSLKKSALAFALFAGVLLSNLPDVHPVFLRFALVRGG